MYKCGRWVAAVLLLGLMASCGGSSGGNNSASSGDKKSTTTVKAAPLGKLTVTPVSSFPNRTLTEAFADGTAIVAKSNNQGANGMSASSLVRLSPAGAVVKEAQLGESYIYDIVKTSAGVFGMGSFETSANGYTRECGFRKIDPAALTLGKTIKTSTDGSCGGGGSLERGVDGAVVWTADSESDSLMRVDTATGKVTTVSLKSSLPAGYDMDPTPIRDQRRRVRQSQRRATTRRRASR